MDKAFLAMDIVVIAATTHVRRVTTSAATHVPLVITVPMEILHPFVLLAGTRQEVLQAVPFVRQATTRQMERARRQHVQRAQARL